QPVIRGAHIERPNRGHLANTPVDTKILADRPMGRNRDPSGPAIAELHGVTIALFVRRCRRDSFSIRHPDDPV
ncbi:MAG: hypothetical protein ABFD89_25255, partial [Bryobacteraceae bacterium]